MSYDPRYSYNIASVEKTMRLIELLAKSGGKLTVSEIASELDTHASSADRFLLTLQDLGYVEKDTKTGKFTLSDKLLDVNSKLIINHPLSERYLDVMHTLAYEFDTTTHIMAFNNLRTITLHKDLQSHYMAYNNAFFDPKRHHYCSAPGKLLLSTLPEEQLKQYLAGIQFYKYTKNTITTEKALRDNLQLIREQGYSVHYEEWLLGNITIAFPLRVDGRIRGAMSLMCDLDLGKRILNGSAIDYIKSKLIEPE